MFASEHGGRCGCFEAAACSRSGKAVGWETYQRSERKTGRGGLRGNHQSSGRPAWFKLVSETDDSGVGAAGNHASEWTRWSRLMTTIGQAVPMIDVRERVTGALQYVLDMELPGMLHARILRSPYPHAHLTKIDASMALDVEGVVAVLTREDFENDTNIKPIYGPQIKDNPIVAIDKVRFVGDPVAAVAAETEAAAEEVLMMIEADYEELAATYDAYEAAQPDAPLIHPMSE